ncbi:MULTISPECIES: phosphatase PAP2 family protein [unclassified Nocardioides]|uniref:phosphatase PAP2 family protein n=1 Tax=unclassified Nocardioides TaxID=2615069 RepID=UPI0013051F78|nr:MULTISPECIES: phosphatase PAP2 family protein [unclassified Nocardioides]
MTTASALARSRPMPRWARGILELVLILALWVVYSLARLLADTDMGPALRRADELLHLEGLIGIQWEVPLNQLFSDHRVLGLAGSYWYATLHYVVTAGVLIWLWRLGADRYGPARRALVIGTLMGLMAYISLPTAPPRFIGGYVDILSLHAADGWWGADASAPRGLGGLTNELAAFPSLHAGWSLWVALALQIYATRKWVRVLGWLYALGTAVVIVGTGNHWVIDAIVGWMVILAGWAAAEAIGRVRLRHALGHLLRRLRRREPGLVLTAAPVQTTSRDDAAAQAPCPDDAVAQAAGRLVDSEQ